MLVLFEFSPDREGENLFHFKTKYLKPCNGFKPIAHKVISFPQKCVKGCPTVEQSQINVDL